MRLLDRTLQEKPLFPPMPSFTGGVWMTVDGIMHRFRIWSYLHGDTVLSAGKRIPVEEFARYEETFCYFVAVICFAAGIIGYFTMTRANRLYIVRLPRWKQWLYWPFHGVKM